MHFQTLDKALAHDIIIGKSLKRIKEVSKAYFVTQGKIMYIFPIIRTNRVKVHLLTAAENICCLKWDSILVSFLFKF